MDGVGGVQFQLCQKLDRCRGARGTVVAVPADEEQGKLACVHFLNSSGVGVGVGGCFAQKLSSNITCFLFLLLFISWFI